MSTVNKYNDRHFSSLARSFELRLEWDENFKFLYQPKSMQQLNTNTALAFIRKKTLFDKRLYKKPLTPLESAMVKVCQEYLEIVKNVKNDSM